MATKALHEVVFLVISIAFAIILMVSLRISSSAEEFVSDNDVSDELMNKGVLIGNDSGINLDSNFTRNEMIVLMIRLLGKENEALSMDENTYIPFKDVDGWARKYVTYAYKNGITNGTSESTFSGKRNITLKELETFILKSLDYKLDEDFKWQTPNTLANSLRITNGIGNSVKLNDTASRRIVNRLVFNSLKTNKKNSNKKLEEFIPVNNQTSSKKVVVGYLPDWSGNFYKTLNFSYLTHVNIAFGNPDETGKISCNLSEEKMKDIVTLAHNAGCKVLISLGGAGGGENYQKLISSDESMKEFNKKIISYVKTNNLDGIDLDIEGDAKQEFWSRYESWVTQLRMKCDESKLLLTTATGMWYSNKITDATFSKFDLVNIMAYDNNVSKENHSSYDYAVKCLNHYANERGISKDKLVLGVPFYGYAYDSYGNMQWGKSKTYKNILASDNGAKYTDNSNTYAYNGEQTIKNKANLSKQYAGIMIWSINQDASGNDSLLKVINDNIKV